MKTRKAALLAFALVATCWAGAAFADTLLYTIHHVGGGSTQYWADGSGRVYSKSCNAAGSCVGRDSRQEQ